MSNPTLNRDKANELKEEVDASFKDAESTFARHADRLAESLAFYKSLQWGGGLDSNGDWWNDTTGEQQEVYNYTIPFVSSWVASVLEEPPNPSVAAAHNELRSRARAKASRNLLRSAIRSGLVPFEEILRATISVPIFGGAWYKTFWNPWKGNLLSSEPIFNTDPETGENIPEYDILGQQAINATWEGDVDLEFYDLFDALPDANARRTRDLEAVFCRKLIVINKLESEHPFDIFGEPTAGRFTDYRQGPGQAERDLVDKGDATAWMANTRAKGNQLARLCEAWYKPSPRFPKGALVVFCGDLILNISPLPYTFPWTYQLGPNASPNSFYGQGIVDPMKQIQRTLNLTVSKQKEIMDVVINPHLLIPRGSDVEKALFSDVPGRQIEFNPGYDPKWMDTPPIPSSFGQLNDQNVAIMKDITGDSGINRGQLPQGVNSARSMAYLERFQKTTNAPNVYLFQLAMKEVFTNVLHLMRDFYDDGRLVKLAGKQKSWTLIPFKKDDYDFNVELVIEPFSGVPTSKVVRQATIMDGLANGLLADTPEAKKARTILELDVEDDDSLEPDTTNDYNRACEEDSLTQEWGELAPIEVLPQDNDQVHLSVHRNFAVSPEYFALTPQARLSHDQHRRAHEEQQLMKENFTNAQIGQQMGGPQGPNSQQGRGNSPGQPKHGSLMDNKANPALDNPINENANKEPQARGPATSVPVTLAAKK